MTELLTELRKREIKVWRDGENLRFSAPKGALTPELRAELTAHKSELLAELHDETGSIPSLTLDVRRLGVPLSFAQERLWVLSQMEPELAAYHVPHCWRILGPLNRPALEWALNEIARRHEILRTTFLTGSDGVPIQAVQSFAPQRLQPVRAAAAELELLAMEESSRPFDLEHGPLWKATLLRFEKEDHALLVTWHHLISDAWSDGIFARELEALYTAFSESRPSPLADLPIQYGDFAAWQRSQATQETLAPHLDYWRKKLGEERPPLTLPGDRPRASRQSYRGALASRALPAAFWERSQRLARSEGITPFMFLLTVFEALLARFTGETDLCIGSPIAQRPRVESEDLIGFFLNILALRTNLSGDPSFREMLRRVRATTLEAFEHQDAPFERIVEELRPVRQVSHHPLFQVAFVLQPAGSSVPTLPGLEITRPPAQTRTSKFDLTLFFEENADGLSATMEYATDQFDAGSVDRMLESLELLLEGALENPDTPLSRLPILSAAGRKQILVDWNNTTRPFPNDQTVSQLFEQWARQTPQAMAIIEAEDSITYEALDARANAIAHHLRKQGTRTGDLIGLTAERSIRFVTGILGILKAGGAYVPLDEKEPEARLAAMRAACAHLLEIPSDLEFGAGATLIPNEASAETPAYVLFTSGSTGTPKGVVVPHRAISRLVMNCDFAQLTPDDAVAFASNACFDAATFEIWGALLNGGKLVVTPRDVVLSPAALERHLARHGITAMFLTTALFNRIAQESTAMFRGIRHLIFGGEIADSTSVRRVLESSGRPERLIHAYGPTETTTFATWHLVEQIEGSSVPIGKPISNTQAYVLDSALQLVPPGVPGEIHIGGPGVALGYLNEPALTAERFLDTPFGRLYKTGDRARWRTDGALDYLGRADTQIKLRGFRIEAGEIETALLKHPGIRHAAVLAREIHGEKALVAYLVRAPAAAPGDKDVREFLQRLVPPQMIPSSFVWLETLPLTANGKLDLRALPALEPARVPAPPSLKSHTELQFRVAELWASVLGRNGFSITDDFFAVGGHSLLAIQLLSQLREKFGVDIPARQLFDAPSIESLAAFIERHATPAASSKPVHSLFPIQRGDETRRPLFLVPGGWGGEIEFFVYGQLKLHLGSEQPLYGLRARGADGVESPHRTVEEMVSSYVSEMRTRQPRGPYMIAGECIGGIVAYEMARVLESQGEKVDLLVLLDTERPSKAALKDFRAQERAEERARFWQVRIRQPAIEHLQKLRNLSFAKKISYIAERIFRRGQRPCATGPAPDQRKLLAHYPRLLMGHTLQSYGGRVTLLINEKFHETDNAMGWDKIQTGGLEIHVVPGDHISYIREHAATAASKLRELIDRTQTAP